ncbi:hypothetical protein EDD68_104165 [Melghiribacillus thermohalophilus]|uniref:Uncharacterized protein n=1 Tax=Melghiribacillus thermohalophilus TaxID=1324956 RepID=A0A4R3N727_9BACI|nr:hypothetical protein EDD68_104165 [Melghiribacillus thermohalophilus]
MTLLCLCFHPFRCSIIHPTRKHPPLPYVRQRHHVNSSFVEGPKRLSVLIEEREKSGLDHTIPKQEAL